MNVFFIDEHNSSIFNGIGTFRNVLVPRLGGIKHIDVTLISLNAECNNLTFIESDFGTEYALPPVNGGDWRSCGDIIWPLLNLYIPDNAANIFIFNHSPAADFIRSMKKVFPQSASIFIIHDQGWCADLFGDDRMLRAIISGRPPKWASKEMCENIVNYFRIEQDIYNEVDRVVCLSDSTENILKKIYKIPADKIVKIYNGYPSERKRHNNRAIARQRLGLSPDDEVLIFIARSAPHKGIIPLLMAVQRLHKRRPHLRVVLSGIPDGFTKYWKIAKKISPAVVLTGHLLPEELKRWYAAADVGVLSSYTEQCSYAALEMMNAGVSIVASDGNGLRDMFTDGRDAMIAHIGNIRNSTAYSKRLATQIDRALSLSVEEQNRMTSAAKSLLRSRYSAIDMANRYADLLTFIYRHQTQHHPDTSF